MTTKEVLGWAFNASGLEVLISVFANDAQAQGVLAQVELENPSALTTSLLKNHSKSLGGDRRSRPLHTQV